MGLKSDIYDALVKNLGEEHITNSSEGQKKVDTLADDLSIAIRDFILAQTFTITKLNASQGAVPVVTPVGPGTIPMITVKIDDQGQGVDNPMAGGKVESMQSKVQLKTAVEV